MDLYSLYELQYVLALPLIPIFQAGNEVMFKHGNVTLTMDVLGGVGYDSIRQHISAFLS